MFSFASIDLINFAEGGPGKKWPLWLHLIFHLFKEFAFFSSHFFSSDFIYLRESKWESEQELGKGALGEGEADSPRSQECDAVLDPQTLGS